MENEKLYGDFLEQVKVLVIMRQKLLNKEIIKIDSIDFNVVTNQVKVLVSYTYADKLVNAKPNYMYGEQDLVQAVKEEEIHIHSYDDGVEYCAIVERAMFPELYSYYIKMAREKLNV